MASHGIAWHRIASHRIAWNGIASPLRILRAYAQDGLSDLDVPGPSPARSIHRWNRWFSQR